MRKYNLQKGKGEPPLYAQVKKILEKNIQCGIYKEKIPSEKELQVLFAVSRTTIRLAIDELVSEGYVVRKRAKGTEIIRQKMGEELDNLGNISTEFKEKNVDYQIQNIQTTIVKADNKIANALEIPQNTNVFYLKRVYYVDNIPFCSIYSYFSPHINLTADESVYQGSVYEYLEKENGIIVSKSFDDIEVAFVDDELSKDLHIEKGKAILLRTRRSFDQREQHVEYTLSYYRADRYKYSRILTK